jgi:hypothetical protein
VWHTSLSLSLSIPSVKITFLSFMGCQVLFQQLPTGIILKDLYLMYGYLIKLNQPLSLANALFNKNCIQILHVGQANQFIDSSIITNIPF